jgi:hypothetical protein
MSKAQDQKQRSAGRVRARVRTLILAVVSCLALLVLPAAAAASDPFGDLTGGSTDTFAPTISSDKADYAPGETVVLTGDNWLPGEHVHITVNDNVGQTWVRESDVNADATGSIRDEFQLPTSFIAEYAVTATGDASGTAQTSFTDGNVKITANMNAQVTETPYESTDCTGDVRKNFPKTETASSSTSGSTAGVGVGNTESVRLDAAANANSPNDAAVFSSWEAVTAGAPFTTIAGTGGKGICVPGFSGEGTREYRIIYAAANSAPTVTRDNASRIVNEGQTATNTGTWADVNALDTVTLSASVGTVTKNADGTWSWSYATTDGPAQSQTVTITATDNHGASSSATFALTVNNVDPTATFPPSRTVDEGSSSSFAFTAPSDPSSADAGAGFHYAFSCTGASLAGETYASSGTSDTHDCTFDDNGSQTVRARIIDKDGGYSEYTTSVTVENVDPTATLGNNGPVDEGSPATVSFSEQSDPSSADTGAGFRYAYACDGGSLESATYAGSGTSASVNCSFGDGPGSQTVRARIIDKDGGFTEYTTAVTIANVKPTATLGNNGPVDEGSPATVSFSEQFDPSTADTSAGFRYAYACDGGSLASATYASSGTPSSHNCTFGDNGSHTVRARIIDKDGGFTEYTTDVTVGNVNPTASNASFTLDPVTGTATAGFDLSDAGWLDSHGPSLSFFTWSDVAGNRNASVTEENIAPDATGHASDTRTLNPGCYSLTVTGTAKDDDGGESAPLSIYSNSEASVYGKAFRPPIVDNERNIAKYGNVVPVKVALTNTCTGATVTNVPLFITIHLGTGGELFDATPAFITESVSSADSGSQMRTADGMYIYNLSTRLLVAGKDYAIRVRPNSATAPWILQAVLHPKK